MTTAIGVVRQDAHATGRIPSAAHVAFAATMIALGIMGLVTGDFAQIWQPAPKWVPARAAVAYVCASASLGAGLGLLWSRTASTAARVLFAAWLAWLVVMRLPNLFHEKPLVLVAWACGSTGVMTAAAWVLATERGWRVARALYGLSLIPFGLAHFMYLDATTVLIPNWLPWHTALAYLTGAAFIAAGLAVAAGVLARQAAVLSTFQFASFGLIVWVPRVVAGTVTPFQRGEFVATCVLTAGAWVVAESQQSDASAPSRSTPG